MEFWTSRGTVYAVNGISFEVAAGETLGIVGESGCGKSVTSLALLGILSRAGRVTGGTAIFGGGICLKLDDDQLRKIRGREIAMIFQDPMSSLNPVLTVGRRSGRRLETHFEMERRPADRRAVRVVEAGWDIPQRRGKGSGTIRISSREECGQRAMIAMALACEPKLLIAAGRRRRSTSAIQAQILDLLRELARSGDTSMILITHDLGCRRGNLRAAST